MRAFLLLLCCTAVAAQQSSPAQTDIAQSNQQKARTVLEQAIQALGGQAYMDVHDSYTEGRIGVYYHGQAEGQEVYFRFYQFPDRERVELTSNRDIAEIYDGDRAYEVTFRGARNLDPEKEQGLKLRMQRSHHSLDRVLRQWMIAPGTALFYEGTILAENHLCDKVTLLNAQNDAVTLLIDNTTHLPVEKVFEIRDPQTRDRDEEKEIYDNWKVVQGINTPYVTQIVHNGEMARQQSLTTVRYNTHFSESLFNPASGLVNKTKQ